MSFTILEHPSDVGFEAHGATFEALADACVQALAAICAGGDIPPGVERRPVPTVEAEEGGLVALLERCLLELDAEDWLAVGYTRGFLRGAAWSGAARANGTHVKAITWHHLSVRQDVSGWHATVYVDL